jgi:hypothetical protein
MGHLDVRQFKKGRRARCPPAKCTERIRGRELSRSAMDDLKSTKGSSQSLQKQASTKQVHLDEADVTSSNFGLIGATTAASSARPMQKRRGVA